MAKDSRQRTIGKVAMWRCDSLMLYLKVIPNVGYRQLGIQDHTRAAREARNMMTVRIRLNTIQGVDGKNRC